MKTAKQQAEKALKELSPKFGDDVYIFSPDGFEQFCKQLCKEQREICAKDISQTKTKLGHKTTIKLMEVVLNAPEPKT